MKGARPICLVSPLPPVAIPTVRRACLSVAATPYTPAGTSGRALHCCLPPPRPVAVAVAVVRAVQPPKKKDAKGATGKSDSKKNLKDFLAKSKSGASKGKKAAHTK